MAAVEYFLKIDGIEGESQDARHKGELDVDAWSWGETQSHPAGGGGGGAGKGSHIKSSSLTGHRAGGGGSDYFLKWTFTDVLVSSYQTGAAEDVPVDNVSLSFAKIEIEYKQQKPDGTFTSFKAGWDLKANKKI
jgi:type VI secretion system secreted protein Hcp